MTTTTEKMIPKISFGNKKLPKSTMIFNIPAVKTCPMKTSLCESACYALKAEIQYKNVVPQARKHNLKLSQSDSFVSLMIEIVNKYKHKIKQVRIHESGDFYNQDYLDKWFMVAREFPSIKFHAYTKSFHLDFSGKPSNFVLIASFDKTTTDKAKLLYSIKKTSFDNTFSIVPKGADSTCIQDCNKCSLCWNAKDQNITVNQH